MFTSAALKEMDMLHGSIMDKLILFAIPAALSGILQQLLNALDVGIVGRFAGSDALAAVGMNGEIINFIIFMLIGISTGSNVLISNCIGSDNLAGIRKAVHTSIMLAIVLGFLGLLGGMICVDFILTLINTPATIYDAAALYLRIYLLGMPFIVVFNFGSAILRCIGDTKRPLYALIFSGVINAVLNFVLVALMDMSVAGVAIATVVSYVISAGIVIILLMREKGYLHLELKELRLDLPELKEIMRIGIPSGIQSCIFCFANIAVQAKVNFFGPEAIAGASIAQAFISLNYYFISGFEYASVTFVSQNYAAKQYERCKKIIICALSENITITLFTSWMTLYFNRELIGLVSQPGIVFDFAVMKMQIILLPYILSAVYEVLSYSLRGLGYPNLPTVLMVTGICGFRLTWLATVQQWHNTYEVLHFVYPASWLFTDILMGVAIVIALRKLLRTKQEQTI